MQIYFITESDTNWDGAKSSAKVYYTCKNDWIDVDIPIGQNGYWSNWIKKIQVHFDESYSATRYHVDSIVIQYDL